jgi:hypothetical protein
MGGEAMRLSFIVNVVPCPTLLSTSNQPSWDSKIVWTMDNPNPVPSGLLVKKGSKIWLRFFSGMPQPLSANLNTDKLRFAQCNPDINQTIPIDGFHRI